MNTQLELERAARDSARHVVAAVWEQRSGSPWGLDPEGWNRHSVSLSCPPPWSLPGASRVVVCEEVSLGYRLQSPLDLRQPYLKLRQILLLVNDKLELAGPREWCVLLDLRSCRFLELSLPGAGAHSRSVLIRCKVSLEGLLCDIFCMVTT